MPSRGARRRAGRRLGLRWAVVAACLCSVGTSAVVQAQEPRGPKPTLIYYKKRSFSIPFNVDPADRERLKLVRLAYSADYGETWKPGSQAPPDRPSFHFRAPNDGEFWFTVQTVDEQGRVYPPNDAPIEPRLKVVVDTAPPTLVLRAGPREGTRASISWDVRDENFDMETLRLEARAPGGGPAEPIAISERGPTGTTSWDARTTAPLKVIGFVADKAKNNHQVECDIPGDASAPAAAASRGPSGFDDGNDDLKSILDGGSPTGGAGSRMVSDQRPLGGGMEESPPRADQPGSRSATPTPDQPSNAGQGASAFGGPSAGGDPFAGPTPAPPTSFGAGSMPPQEEQRPAAPKMLVGSPRFPLQYEVQDAGPNGASTVELWVTRDRGRTWTVQPEDPDRASPYLVDLKGEGYFGLTLAARSPSGLGDRPPSSGDAPQMWVEVDTSPPLIQFDRPEVGAGPNAGKVAITWRANDANLGSPCVLLSWRAEDGPADQWNRISEPMDNSGKYIWVVPPDVPDRIHLRIDVIDTLRNRSYADTTTSGPLILDRAKPRGRIIGLDPSYRLGGLPQNPQR